MNKEFNLYFEESMAVRDAYSLLTANVHFFTESQKFKSITITSWNPRVGKTTVAINLAISLAKAGWKTLLVDADLRKPGHYKRLNSNAVPGLSDIIVGDINLQDGLSDTSIANLNYLSCGQANDNPIELLCSPKLTESMDEIKTGYDFIICDTPALSSVIDGALVASQTDAAILIAHMGQTKLTALQRAKEQLGKANCLILGVVLNKVKKRDYVKYVESYDYFLNPARFQKNKIGRDVNFNSYRRD